MNLNLFFNWANGLALIGWILLLVFWKKNLEGIIIGTIITLLACLYLYLIFLSFSLDSFKDFNSLDGIRQLFNSNTLLLAGWIHYLTFDLMIGIFIKMNARKYKLNPLLVFPCLILSFLFGPMGLLSYLIIRMIKSNHYFLETN